jgi:hypothetical protein
MYLLYNTILFFYTYGRINWIKYVRVVWIASIVNCLSNIRSETAHCRHVAHLFFFTFLFQWNEFLFVLRVTMINKETWLRFENKRTNKKNTSFKTEMLPAIGWKTADDSEQKLNELINVFTAVTSIRLNVNHFPKLNENIVNLLLWIPKIIFQPFEKFSNRKIRAKSWKYTALFSKKKSPPC